MLGMSIDTEIWTKQEGLLRDLPIGERWTDEGDSLVMEGDGWLLSIFEPEPVDEVDIPSEIRAATSGMRFRVEASLEPAGAPPGGLTALSEAVSLVGSHWGGAALDPETGHVRTWP
jgi:hypothetical protein